MAEWDVIVIGLGGVGSSAAYHIAASGRRVLGLDQFTAAHDRGSSHGHTRIIRQAYFEHPSYVPLLKRAYELWDDLEHDSGRELFRRTGLVEAGPSDGVVVPGVLKAAEQHQLPIENLSYGDVRKRWPGVDGAPEWSYVVEQNAGYLRVEDCVAAHLRLAQRAGATLRFEQSVIDWKVVDDGVEVTTNQGTHRGKHLVIAGGAWSGQLLSQLGVPLQILRKHLWWFEPDTPGFGVDEGFPCFFHETPAGYFYGFPSIDNRGVKVARHSGGEPITGPVRNDAPDDDDRALCEQYVRQCLPGVSDRLKSHTECFYTCTPDEHFIIDRHPQHAQVTVIAGLSGHGFKFTSVLGEIASQMVAGDTDLDINLFRIDRFST